LSSADTSTALTCSVAFACIPTSPSCEFFSAFDIGNEMRFGPLPALERATPLL
jgi:hypothetical protein